MGDLARRRVILMADDDDEDVMMANRALQKARVVNDLIRVRDGEELLDYLRRKGPFEEPGAAPSPALILLDLNMPRMSGLEALREIRADRSLCHHPIVILTTSDADEDVIRSYQLGVSSFVKKPVTFEGFIQAMSGLSRYWFELVELPSERGGRAETARPRA